MSSSLPHAVNTRGTAPDRIHWWYTIIEIYVKHASNSAPYLPLFTLTDLNCIVGLSQRPAAFPRAFSDVQQLVVGVAPQLENRTSH